MVYYQVQLQMLLTNISACYFVVYGLPLSLCEKIYIDEVFLAERVNQGSKFFSFAILPELLAKWYSRDHVSYPEVQNKESTSDDTCCTCRESKTDGILVCQDKTCVITNDHLSCLGLDVKPKGKWFCPYSSRKKTRRKKKSSDPCYEKYIYCAQCL